MGKFFLIRFFYFLFVFMFILGFVIPLFSIVVASAKAWLLVGSWVGFDFQFALRFLKGGLIITPIAAFLLTLNEYARYRGWWK